MAAPLRDSPFRADATPGRDSRPFRAPVRASLPRISVFLMPRSERSGHPQDSARQSRPETYGWVYQCPPARQAGQEGTRAAARYWKSGHGQQPEAPPLQSLTVLPLLDFRQLAVLVYTPPAPQGERIIARASSYHAPPLVPEIREINIIYRDCVTPRIKGVPPQRRHQSSRDRSPPRPSYPLRVSTI